MKKIFTLLTCTILISAAAFADDGHHDHDRGNGGYDRSRSAGREEFRGGRDGHDSRSFGHEEFRGGRDDHDGRGFAPLGRFIGSVVRDIRIRPAVNVSFTYHNYQYGFNQRDIVISRINAYYDQQIQDVDNDWSLRDWQRRDAINNIEAQRTAEINNIYTQCGDTASYPAQY